MFPEGTTLNLARPGYHATERTKALNVRPDTPMGDPAGFGQVVAFLWSQYSGFVSGVAPQVDGARTLGPL